MSEVNYMITNHDEVSFHFACDTSSIVQGIPCDRNAWHAGDGDTFMTMDGVIIDENSIYNGLGSRRAHGYVEFYDAPKWLDKDEL